MHSDNFCKDEYPLLLNHIIDYAGSSPPSALSWENSLLEAKRFLGEDPNAFLYAKCVAPISHCLSFTPEMLNVLNLSSIPSWELSALSSVLLESKGHLGDVQSDIAKIDKKNETDTGYGIVITSYEIGISSLNLEEVLRDLLAIVAIPNSRSSRRTSTSLSRVYLELARTHNNNPMASPPWLRLARTLIDWIAYHRDQVPFTLGLKLRCGGAHPLSLEELSEILLMCGEKEIPLKFTQGLHHAVSALETSETTGESKAFHLGFLNLFRALSLSYLAPEIYRSLSLSVTPDTLRQCLLSLEHCHSYSLPVSDIKKAKAKHQATFGSCSLREPSESLSRVYPKSTFHS